MIRGLNLIDLKVVGLLGIFGGLAQVQFPIGSGGGGTPGGGGPGGGEGGGPSGDAGGQGSAAPDNPLVAILQLLTKNQKVQADYMRQKTDGDREQRFKIHRNIPKITAEGATSLLDEFDEFEIAFT